METMILSLVLFVLSYIVEIYGHGMMMDPPARNSMWRVGFDNPPDYDDNQLYCGGYDVQFDTNGGKCGLCGDDYRDPVPRAHEDGGYYGNGIIVRTYKIGQQISITADITANHLGHMEAKICSEETEDKNATQRCLDSHPLNLVGQNTNKYTLPSDKPGLFTWDVQLPPSLTCSQCVIQWSYVAGNNWGTCDNGTQADGCGPQETFVNCADVEILSYVSPLSGSNWRNYIGPDSKAIFYSGDEFGNVVKKDDSVDGVDEKKPLVVSSQLCLPVGESKNNIEMMDWCRTNCLKYPPECPPEKCECVHDCVAIGEFAKQKNADRYCLQNCLKFPSYCPEERCKCT